MSFTQRRTGNGTLICLRPVENRFLPCGSSITIENGVKMLAHRVAESRIKSRVEIPLDKQSSRPTLPICHHRESRLPKIGIGCCLLSRQIFARRSSRKSQGRLQGGARQHMIAPLCCLWRSNFTCRAARETASSGAWRYYRGLTTLVGLSSLRLGLLAVTSRRRYAFEASRSPRQKLRIEGTGAQTAAAR